MLTVKFKKKYKLHKKGEVAEVPEKRAFWLKDKGILEIIEEQNKEMRASLPTRTQYVTK